MFCKAGIRAIHRAHNSSSLPGAVPAVPGWKRFIKIRRVKADGIAVVSGNGKPNALIDGGGHYVAVIIVHVFADQVDTARRNHTAGSEPKAPGIFPDTACLCIHATNI